MNLLSLVFVNLFRNKRRTILTFLSVTVALFLYAALGGVLDTLEDSIKVGSETRLVSRNAVSLVFPMPFSYRDRILAVPGVKNVGVQNWFGGQDPKDPKNFFAQFAVDEEFYAIYRDEMDIVAASEPQAGGRAPEGVHPELAAYFEERTACVMGQALMQKNGWKVGQTITLAGTIYPGDWEFTIRAVYAPKKKSFGAETMFFHFDYLDERGMGNSKAVGVYVLELSDPGNAGAIARRVDETFENSAAATRTETEQAFQAGFVSMYGNIPFVIRVVGLAVVFAILLVAANTMVMAVRERTSEIGVLKTLGFSDGTVFTVILAEAAVITVLAGTLGAMGAKFAIESASFNMGGFLPPMTIYWSTVLTGIAISAVVGAVSGIIPAWGAYRLPIVDALRRID